MAYLLNMDKASGATMTFLCEEVAGIQRGIALEIKGKAQHTHFSTVAEDDFEAYKVSLATADTKAENLVIHTSVPTMYDERLMEQDFVLGKGQVGRGHSVEKLDVFTIAEELILTTVATGDKIKLAANGKYDKVTASEGTIIGEVQEKCTFGGQKSVKIRFY